MTATHALLTTPPPLRRARLADAEAIARVHVQAWHETYSGLLPEDRIARQTEADRTHQWRQLLVSAGRLGPVVFVAVPEGRVEGFACLGPQRSPRLKDLGYDAEVSAIYLTAAVQGRGLGRLMMCAAAHALLDDGRRGLALWALRANRRACAFYEALGGAPVGERTDSDGAQLAFGWDDPGLLL